MNWDALAAIAETVGALGVIASLIYVGVQVRQNTRSVRTATYEALVRSSSEFLNPVIQNPALATSFESAVADWASLNPEHRAQVNYLFTQMFRLWENAFFQMQERTLDPTLWEAWRHVMLSYFHQPGVREWWKGRGMAYSSRYRDFLEASTPVPGGIRTWPQLAGDRDNGETDQPEAS